jgi:hypothetical protein
MTVAVEGLVVCVLREPAENSGNLFSQINSLLSQQIRQLTISLSKLKQRKQQALGWKFVFREPLLRAITTGTLML